LCPDWSLKHKASRHLTFCLYPGNIELKQGAFRLTENFTVTIHQPASDTILVKAVNRMYQTLNRRSGLYFKQKSISPKNNSGAASFQVTVDKAVLPSIGADESYSVIVNE
jgi:hexosaminidase